MGEFWTSTMIGNLYAMFSEELSTFLFISQKQWRFQFQTYHNTRRHICHHVKHRKREPEGVHGQLEGCNRNLRSKAAVANNNNLAPNLFLNFVQNTSFSIVLKFGAKLSIRLEDISKLRKILLYMFQFCEDFGELIRKSLPAYPQIKQCIFRKNNF